MELANKTALLVIMSSRVQMHEDHCHQMALQ